MDHLMANYRVRLIRDQVVHIKRSLPRGGVKIDVRVGQEVMPGDILGEGMAPAGFRTIYLAKELGVDPHLAQNYLKRHLGQTIYQGELLASREGFWSFGKKNILAPTDGIIDLYDPRTGNLKIKHLPKKIPVASGVYGTVDKVDHEAGIVLLRSVASIIYGVLGSGKERGGLLKIRGSAADWIGARQISQEMKGHILVGGGTIFLDALEKAVNIGLAGLISGGINARDYKSMADGGWNQPQKHWSDVGLSLLVTEGFGSIPIGEDIFQLLLKHQEKYALLDGNRARLILPSSSPDCMMYIRRTRLPPGIEVEPEPEVNLTPLKAGSTVRVVAGSDLGVQGKVEAVDQVATYLPSGIMTFLVSVATRSRKIRVPYLNLEIIR